MQDFVHLHVHTHYSMLDGACKIPALVKRAKALGMSSLAISDHGSLFGIVEFFSECKKEGIKPIIGLEAYMAPGDRRERSTPSGSAGDAAYHLLLLATDLQGYQNLLRLGSIAYREGFYYKPRIDKAVLKEFSQGLVATSACLGGEVANAFLKRDTKNAKAIAEQYLEIFGPDRFFIEVQKQGIKEQDMVNPELAGLADRLGCGIVGTNDVHFLTAEDHYAHDVLCCISMGKLITDENRLKYPTQLYLKSPEEMHQALSEYPQAISNTLRIAEMCNLDLDFSKRHAPVYRVPQEKLTAEMPPLPEGRDTCADDERYLRQLCEEGLVWRYGTTDVDADVRARLAKELNVIVSKNFCSYFLIVWDFCNYARDNGIPVGARGSGVGTMVGYLLGLCNVDPVKYGLLFERFMDPSRNEMPDIDIDICQDGRPRVIDYVRKKYGHVAQIITFGTLAAKAACKDVGRVMGVPLQDIDRLTKLIPGIPGMTLDKALASVPDLSQLYKDDGRIKQVIDIAKRLEGLCRNAGCHAAGVVIADQPLDNFVPLYVDKDDNVLTQFEGPVVEKVGLLKMDFLGLRTLSVLQRSIHLVKEVKGVDIDIEKIDLTDRSVLALFCRGESRGIFQFESGGMQDLLMKMQPDRIEDLIAANALYRPGPMELIPLYCNRKHGREQVPSVHPAMDAILAETYGIMVYQEQVMQIFNQLGGIELSSAYKLIKAISKKLSDVIAKFKPEFLKGAMERGITKAAAEELFDLILKFGGYGFNKSHSTRYAIVAFQTAYMKVYHPIEYMAALLTYESGSTEKVVEYIDECRKMTLLDGSRGIQVLPPDINISRVDFTPVYEKKNPNAPKPKRKAAPAAPSGVIRFGLGAVKGVGTKAVEQIMAERDKNGPFTSLFDFCERVDLRAVNRSTLDALIKCGAFDNLGGHRAQLLAVLDRAIEMGQQTQADKRSGQGALFGGNTEETTGTALAKPSIPMPDVEQFPSADLLKQEKEVLGFYITSHPLAEHQMTLAHLGTDSTRSAGSRSEGSDVCIGAMISEVRSRIAKSGRSAGQRWAIVKFEDLEGSIEGMVFAEKFGELMSRDARLLAAESIIFVRGKVDRKRENPCLVVNDIFSVDEGPGRLTTGLLLKIDRDRHKPDVMSEIKPLLTRHKGPTPVFLQVSVDDNSRTAMLRLNSEASIKPSRDLKEDLEMLLGSGAVQLCGPGTKRQQKQQRQEKLFAGATEPATPASTFADQEAMQIESLDAEMAEA